MGQKSLMNWRVKPKTIQFFSFFSHPVPRLRENMQGTLRFWCDPTGFNQFPSGYSAVAADLPVPAAVQRSVAKLLDLELGRATLDPAKQNRSRPKGVLPTEMVALACQGGARSNGLVLDGKIFTGNHGFSHELREVPVKIAPKKNKSHWKTKEVSPDRRGRLFGVGKCNFWCIQWGQRRILTDSWLLFVGRIFFPTLFQGKTSKTYWLQSCKGNGSRGVWTSSKVCWRGWNPWMVSCWWAAVRSMWRPISLSKTAWRWKLITFLNMSFTFHAYSGYFCMIVVGGGSSFSILLYNFG